MNPEISIIVPIYTKEHCLRKCIDSILNQTFFNIEIILIDDGSHDSSYNICKEYATKNENIRLLRKKNGGVSSARNLGLTQCKGKFIGFVDPDDHLEFDAIDYSYKLIKEYDADIVAYKMSVYKEGVNIDSQTEVEKIEVFHEKQIIEEYIKTGKFLYSVWNKLYTRKILMNNNILFSENLHYAEDVLFNYEVFQHAKTLVFSNLRKYHYNINDCSTVNKVTLKRIDILKSQIKIYKSLSVSYPDYKNYMLRDYIGSANLIAMDIAREKRILKKTNILFELDLFLKQNKMNLSDYDYQLTDNKNKLYFRILTISPILFSCLYKIKINLFENKVLKNINLNTRRENIDAK